MLIKVIHASNSRKSFSFEFDANAFLLASEQEIDSTVLKRVQDMVYRWKRDGQINPSDSSITHQQYITILEMFKSAGMGDWLLPFRQETTRTDRSEATPIEARSKLGLSIAEMASLMGVHRDTWGKWERGQRQPDQAAVRLMQTLVWIAENGLLEAYKASI
jgi:DNA-binding XRE family transcriptional regulator